MGPHHRRCLPRPARAGPVYDSRPGTTPTEVGPKTRFRAAETRTFDLRAAGSGVPAGATTDLVIDVVGYDR